MPKYASPDVIDGALHVVAGATRMVALGKCPKSYAEAAKKPLAVIGLSRSDFALLPGLVSGRRAEVAAKVGVPIVKTGDADHVALLDDTSQRLLYVTTCPEQRLAKGGTVAIASWSVEIGAPE